MGDKSPAAKSYAEQVNDVVNQMTQGDDGKWQMPDGEFDEAMQFAVNAERRRRDTQSEYTRQQQKLKGLEAENQLLAQDFEANYVTSLSAKEQADLEELKATDPDAWRTKLSDMERDRREQFQTKRTEIQQKAQGESEADYRARALVDFQEQNPDLVLNDDVIANDIPPRLTKELEQGKISFGDFLDKCAEYLGKPRKMAPTDKAPNNVNLSNLPGSSKPGGDATAANSKATYDSEIY